MADVIRGSLSLHVGTSQQRPEGAIIPGVYAVFPPTLPRSTNDPTQRLHRSLPSSNTCDPTVAAPSQVCVMIHSGSRGLGHQVATDALVEMERAMARDKIRTNDRQVGGHTPRSGGWGPARCQSLSLRVGPPG